MGALGIGIGISLTVRGTGGGASDTTAPTVTITSTESSPSFAATIPITITFSEAVTGFVVGDITAVGCSLSDFSGSGASYTVTATPTTNAVTLDIAAGVCVDTAGNANQAASQFAITSFGFGIMGRYDFSDIATLFQDAARTSAITADGQVILGVTDKSGAGNHASSIATKGPLYKTGIQNSLSAALWDATPDDYLAANGLAAIFSGSDKALTIYTVYKKRVANANCNIWSLGKAASDTPIMRLRSQFAASFNDLFRRDDASASKTLTTGTVTTNTRLHTVIFTGTVGSQFQEGSQVGVDTDLDVGAMTVDKFTIGALGRIGYTESWDGYIMEMVVYSTAHTPTQRGLIEANLNTKWAVF